VAKKDRGALPFENKYLNLQPEALPRHNEASPTPEKAPSARNKALANSKKAKLSYDRAIRSGKIRC